MVFQFLCWINANRANSLLKELVQKFSTKAESIRLLSFLMDLVPEYQEASFMKLPLPKYLEITPKVDMKRLLSLWMSDCESDMQNMCEIQLKIVPELLHCFDASYVKQMSVNVNTEEDIKKVKTFFQTAVKLTRAEIRFNKVKGKLTESGKHAVMSSLVRHKLTELTVEGSKVSLALSSSLSKLSGLVYLTVRESDVAIEEQHVQTLLGNLEKCGKLQKFTLEVEIFMESIFKSSFPTKFAMKVRRVSKENFHMFVTRLSDKTLCLQELDMGARKDFAKGLNETGSDIAALLKFCKIQVLNLNRWLMNSQTLEAITQSLLPEDNINIRELYLRNNDLNGSGGLLKTLLEHMTELTVLDFTSCNLTGPDVEMVGESFISCSKIERLLLTKNCLNHVFSNNIFSSLENLQLLRVAECQITGSTVNSLLGGNQNFPNLAVLDVHHNDFTEDGLIALTSCVSKMVKLSGLDISYCKCKNVDNFLYFLQRIPKSLTHLIASGNDFGSDVIQILNVKSSLSNLKKLDIGRSYENDLRESIAEELKLNNPLLHVYSDPASTLTL